MKLCILIAIAFLDATVAQQVQHNQNEIDTKAAGNLLTYTPVGGLSCDYLTLTSPNGTFVHATCINKCTSIKEGYSGGVCVKGTCHCSREEQRATSESDLVRIEGLTCDHLTLSTTNGPVGYSACIDKCIFLDEGYDNGECRDGTCYCWKDGRGPSAGRTQFRPVRPPPPRHSVPVRPAVYPIRPVRPNVGTCQPVAVSTPYGNLNHDPCAQQCINHAGGYFDGVCINGHCECNTNVPRPSNAF